MKTAYLSLGSNLGDRERHLASALARLSAPDLSVTRVSSVYETEPRDLPNQPRFLNLVAAIETSLLPMQLLRRAGRVELELGRKRTIANGPRIIDIDILAFGRFIIDTPKLRVPHPRLRERRFMLEPLAELEPEWRHPATKESVGDLLAAVRNQGSRRLGPLNPNNV